MHSHDVAAEAVSDALVIAPTETQVSLARAVAHVKPLEDADHVRLEDLLAVADRAVEAYLGACVLRATWCAWFTPDDARRLRLREGPIAEVVKVEAFAEDDDTPVLVPSERYRVLSFACPSEVAMREGAVWPVTLRASHGVAVTYRAGQTSPHLVPADIRHAALLLVAHLFEHPAPVLTGTIAQTLPFTVEHLLAPHVQRRRCAA